MQNRWREDVPMNPSPWRFFLFASRPYVIPASIAIFLAAAGNVLSASVSYVFKLIADSAAALTHGGTYEPFLYACILYIGVLGFAKMCYRMGGFASASWAIGSRATARYALTSYVTLHSRSYFSDRFAGSIMTKIRHASQGMHDMVEALLWQFIELGVNVIASFVIAYMVSRLIALIFLVWVIVIVILNWVLVRKRVPLTAHAHDLETSINGATVDLLSNSSAMQEYARRDFELQRIQNAIEIRSAAGFKSWYFGEYIRLANSAVLVVFGGAMVFMTATLARSGIISIGDIILIVSVIFRIEGHL